MKTAGIRSAIGSWSTPGARLLLDMGEEKGVGFAEIDLKRISDVRSRIPALNHRRPIPDAVTL